MFNSIEVILEVCTISVPMPVLACRNLIDRIHERVRRLDRAVDRMLNAKEDVHRIVVLE